MHAAPEKSNFAVIEAPCRACQAASRSSTLVVSSKSAEQVARSIALPPSSQARHAACVNLTPPSSGRRPASFAGRPPPLMSNVRSPQGAVGSSRARSLVVPRLECSNSLVLARCSMVVRIPEAFTSRALRFTCAKPGRPSSGGRLTVCMHVPAPRLLASRAARPLASSSPARFASFRAGARRFGEVQVRRHRNAAPSLPSCKPFKHTGRIEQVRRATPSRHRVSSIITSKARRMRKPNPSIERTSSSQLRWPAAAAHVER